MAEWRTATVVQLCNHIVQNEDWSTLPILADALEEGGYEEGSILTDMRSGYHTKHEALRLIALVRSERTKKAVEWIDGFLDTMPEMPTEDSDGHSILGRTNYERMMTAADRATAEGDWLCLNGYGDGMDWSNEFSGENARKFWEAYTAITGNGEPRYREFISCSC